MAHIKKTLFFSPEPEDGEAESIPMDQGISGDDETKVEGTEEAKVEQTEETSGQEGGATNGREKVDQTEEETGELKINPLLVHVR